MKNILLLTDFSKDAKSAADTALILSQKLHTDLLMLNTFLFLLTAENYVGDRWHPELFKEKEEESQEHLYQLKQRLEELSPKTLNPGDRQPVISSQVEDFGLNFALTDILEKGHIELIVMGSHEERAFGANHVNAVIRHANVPVLVVPTGIGLKQAAEVIYATDYSAQDFEAINDLVKIAKALHSEIKVVHVINTEEKEYEETKREAFEAHLKKSHNSYVTFHTIKGKDIITRLLHMAKTEHASLLCMLHHQHSFFGRLITHSNTKELLKYKKVPVLIFPAKE